MTTPLGTPPSHLYSRNSNTEIPSIPAPPVISEFKFTTIGKLPTLLARFSSPDKDNFEHPDEPTGVHFDSLDPKGQSLTSQESAVEAEASGMKPTLLERIQTQRTGTVNMDVDMPEATYNTTATLGTHTITAVPLHTSRGPVETPQPFPTLQSCEVPIPPPAIGSSSSSGINEHNTRMFADNAYDRNSVKPVGAGSSQSAHPSQPPPPTSGSSSTLTNDAAYSLVREIKERLHTTLSSFTSQGLDKAGPLIQPIDDQCSTTLRAAQNARSLAEKSLLSAQESIAAARECLSAAEAVKMRADEITAALESLHDNMRQRQQKWSETFTHTKEDLERLAQWIEKRQLEEETLRLREKEKEQDQNSVLSMSISTRCGQTPGPDPLPSNGPLTDKSMSQTQIDDAVKQKRREAEESMRSTKARLLQFRHECDSALRRVEEEEKKLRESTNKLRIDEYRAPELPSQHLAEEHDNQTFSNRQPANSGREPDLHTHNQGPQSPKQLQRLASQELNSTDGAQSRVSSEERETVIRQTLCQRLAKDQVAPSSTHPTNVQKLARTSGTVTANTQLSSIPDNLVTPVQSANHAPIGTSSTSVTAPTTSTSSSVSSAGANGATKPLPKRSSVQASQQRLASTSQLERSTSQSSAPVRPPDVLGQTSSSSPTILSNVRQQQVSQAQAPLPPKPVTYISTPAVPANQAMENVPVSLPNKSVHRPLSEHINPPSESQKVSSTMQVRTPVKQETQPDDVLLGKNRTSGEALLSRSLNKGGLCTAAVKRESTVPMLTLPSPTPSLSPQQATAPKTLTSHKLNLPSPKAPIHRTSGALPHPNGLVSSAQLAPVSATQTIMSSSFKTTAPSSIRPAPTTLVKSSPIVAAECGANTVVRPAPAVQPVPVSVIQTNPVSTTQHAAVSVAQPAPVFTVQPSPLVSLLQPQRPASSIAIPASTTVQPQKTNGSTMPFGYSPDQMRPDPTNSGGWSREEPEPSPIVTSDGDRHARSIKSGSRRSDYYSPPPDHGIRRSSSEIRDAYYTSNVPSNYNNQRLLSPPVTGQKRYRDEDSPPPRPQRSRLDDSSNKYYNAHVRGTPEIYGRSLSPNQEARLGPGRRNRDNKTVHIGSSGSYRPTYDRNMDSYVPGEDYPPRPPANNQRRSQQPRNGSHRDLLARMGGDEDRSPGRPTRPRGGRGIRGCRTGRRVGGSSLEDRLDL